jgi:hypothetical protein
MRLLIYSKFMDDYQRTLLNQCKQIIPMNHIEIHRNYESLKFGIINPVDHNVVTLLLCNSDNDLNELLSINEYLRLSRVILMVHQNSQLDHIKMYELNPRFISYSDSYDFSEVLSIVNKISCVFAVEYSYSEMKH